MKKPKTVRINITQAADLIDSVDADAAKRGMNRSQWFDAAARNFLPGRVAKQIPKKAQPGRPKKDESTS